MLTTYCAFYGAIPLGADSCVPITVRTEPFPSVREHQPAGPPTAPPLLVQWLLPGGQPLRQSPPAAVAFAGVVHADAHPGALAARLADLVLARDYRSVCASAAIAGCVVHAGGVVLWTGHDADVRVWWRVGRHGGRNWLLWSTLPYSIAGSISDDHVLRVCRGEDVLVWGERPRPLDPGEVVVASPAGVIRERAYLDQAPAPRRHSGTLLDSARAIREALLEATRDIAAWSRRSGPIGLALGNIDSSALLAALTVHGARVIAYTLCPPSPAASDEAYARLTCQALNVPFRPVREVKLLSPEWAGLPIATPFCRTTLAGHLALARQAASDHVGVIVTGSGCDQAHAIDTSRLRSFLSRRDTLGPAADFLADVAPRGPLPAPTRSAGAQELGLMGVYLASGIHVCTPYRRQSVWRLICALGTDARLATLLGRYVPKAALRAAFSDILPAVVVTRTWHAVSRLEVEAFCLRERVTVRRFLEPLVARGAVSRSRLEAVLADDELLRRNATALMAAAGLSASGCWSTEVTVFISLCADVRLDVHDRCGVMIDRRRGLAAWVREPELSSLMHQLLWPAAAYLLACSPRIPVRWDDPCPRYLELGLGTNRSLVVDDPPWLARTLHPAAGPPAETSLIDELCERGFLERCEAPCLEPPWSIAAASVRPRLTADPCPGMAALLADPALHEVDAAQLLVWGARPMPPTPPVDATVRRLVGRHAQAGATRLLVSWPRALCHLRAITPAAGAWGSLEPDARLCAAMQLISPIRHAVGALEPLIVLRRCIGGGFAGACLLDSLGLACGYRALGLAHSLVIGRALHAAPVAHRLNAWVEVDEEVVNGPANLRDAYREVARYVT